MWMERPDGPKLGPPGIDPVGVVRVNHDEDDKLGDLVYINFEPQNSDKSDVVRRFASDFPCKRSADEEMQRVQNDFSNFANFEGDFGPLGAPGFHASLTFGSGPASQGRNIPISNTVSNNAVFDSLRFSNTMNTSVTVRDATHNELVFDTAPNHPFYPGAIIFGTMNMGRGQIKFSVNVFAHFNGRSNDFAFNYGGGEFLEGKIWNNLINNVKADCSH